MSEAERHVVYRFYDAADDLLYVGCTVHMPTRTLAHAASQPWWAEVARTETKQFPSRTAALDAERTAIKSEHPRYNSTDRDTLNADEARELSRAAKQVTSWTERRNGLIRAAAEAGVPLRRIARATGLNVGTVHTMLHGRKR